MVYVVCPSVCLSHGNNSKTKWDRRTVKPCYLAKLISRHARAQDGNHSRHSTGTACFVVYIVCIVVCTASLKEKEITTTLGTMAGQLSTSHNGWYVILLLLLLLLLLEWQKRDAVSTGALKLNLVTLKPDILQNRPLFCQNRFLTGYWNVIGSKRYYY